MQIKVTLLLFFVFVLSANAQIYTPNSTIQGTSINNNIGIGTASPVGNLDINTGIGGISNPLNLLPNGTISFGNGAGAAALPNIVGKSNDSAGLQLMAGTNDINVSPDMSFNVRKNDNNDFTTLTSTAFRFSRFGKVLVDVLRNGNVGIGNNAPVGKLDVAGVKTTTYTSSLNSPTNEF